MASTQAMFLAGLALILNTALLVIMGVASNWILSPILSVFERLWSSTSLLTPGDVSYIIPGLWAILILFEIVCIISFVVVASRRNEVAYDIY